MTLAGRRKVEVVGWWHKSLQISSSSPNNNHTIKNSTTIMVTTPSNTSTLNDLIDIEMQFLSRLMVTIESQQWEVLGNAIVNNPELFRTFARSIASSPTHHLNGMTM